MATPDEERGVSEEERALFRRSVGAVRPIRKGRKGKADDVLPTSRQEKIRVSNEPSRLVDTSKRPQTPRKKTPRIQPAALAAPRQFRRAGMRLREFERLRRNPHAAEAELDLHGETLETARRSLDEFISGCMAQDVRRIRVIHGKGHRSPAGRAAIKPALEDWLRACPGVLAYWSARPSEGGDGALNVWLRRT